MAEGLTPKDNEDANYLGNNRKVVGETTNAAQAKANLDQVIVDTFADQSRAAGNETGVARAEATLAQSRREEAAMQGLNDQTEADATAHYEANEDAYQEQAVKDAKAAGTPTNWPGQGSAPTPPEVQPPAQQPPAAA